MSDILRVTTPVSGQEGVNRVRPSTNQEMNVQNIPDPHRVTQPNSQNVFTEREPAGGLPNFESNYERYLQMLKAAGGAINIYEDIFFNRTGFLVSAGIEEGLASEISEFMELLKMDEAGLMDLVKGQLEGASKFSGPLFRMMLDIYQGARNEDVRAAILGALQRYDSMSSSQHILKELLFTLNNIAEHLPERYAEQLEQMIGQLAREHPAGQNALNLNIFKNQILPFLSKYVSQRHDLGSVRELSAMFTLNLARYEGGSAEALIESLRELMNHEEIASRFPGIDQKEFENLFFKLPEKGGDNVLIERLISIISKGVAGSAGTQNRAVFDNLLQSILINESVYMPLLHAMIPANVNGSMFFSEMWVDPEAEGGQTGGGQKAVKILIKFDIKNMGFFEMIILAKDKNVDLMLYYPERFDAIQGEIREGIAEIIGRNALTLNSFSLEQAAQPIAVSEVFPKVFERKNAINVVV